MTHEIKYTLLVITLILVSCKRDSRSFNKELKTCINEKINKILNDDLGYFQEDYKHNNINIFDSIRKFEIALIDQKIMKENNSKSYLKLLDNLKNNRLSFKIDSIVSNQDFLKNLNSLTFTKNIIYDNCIDEIAELFGQKENADLFKINEVYDDIIYEVKISDENLKSLICLKSFDENESFRLSVTNLFFTKILYRKEPVIEFKKTKDGLFKKK